MTTPVSGLSGIVRSVELDAVRLVGCACKADVLAVPSVATKMDLNWTSEALERKTDNGPRGFDVLVKFRLAITSREDAAKEFVSLSGLYRLSYALHEGVEPSPEELKLFADGNAVFNVWPYWREFVQSTMSRMGLPPITIPVFRVLGPRDEASRPTGAASDK